MKKNENNNLYEKLIEYSEGPMYAMHMPGHKRKMMTMEDPYRFDLTEIDGFDNLHEAEGVLAAEMALAAELYGAEETHMVINGSTGALLAAIGGALHKGDAVLMSRGCHTSVYHALELNALKPVFIWPKIDEHAGMMRALTVEDVKKTLAMAPFVKALIMTSPTYEGEIADVAGIADACHEAGILLIVDEAHGAHLRFAGFKDSIACGADLVIQSLHKTMPCLTQTALLHMQGELVDRERVRRMLAVYQTSSPSYVLMASISQCLHWTQDAAADAFEAYKENVLSIRKELDTLRYFKVYQAMPDHGDYDWGKFVITTDQSRLSGPMLYDRLRLDYYLQPEMVSAEYVLCMTTVGDTKRALKHLLGALKDTEDWIDEGGPEEYNYGDKPEVVIADPSVHQPKCELPLYEAVDMDYEWTELSEAEGKIVQDYLYLYPPGIPALIPGEVISKEEIRLLKSYMACGLKIHGGVKENQYVKTVLCHGKECVR